MGAEQCNRGAPLTFGNDMSQQDTHDDRTQIVAPDYSASIHAEAIPTTVRSVSPSPERLPTATTCECESRLRENREASYYGHRLIRRGLTFLGLALLVAATWYISAWIHHGRSPMPMSEPTLGHIVFEIGSKPPTPEWIRPPIWVFVATTCLTLTSLAMMFTGVQHLRGVSTRR